jgi:hypothetical protein
LSAERNTESINAGVQEFLQITLPPALQGTKMKDNRFFLSRAIYRVHKKDQHEQLYSTDPLKIKDRLREHYKAEEIKDYKILGAIIVACVLAIPFIAYFWNIKP